MTVAKSLLGFGGLGIALISVLGSELIALSPGTPNRAPVLQLPERTRVTHVPAVAAPATDLVRTILARPLFQITRRPPAASAAPVAAGPSGLPRLTGVMASNLGKRLIFAPGVDGKPVVVAEGGHIGSYLVQSIGVGEAVVIGPDGPKTLRPAFNSPAFSSNELNASGGPVLAGASRNAIIELMRGGAALPGMGIQNPVAPQGMSIDTLGRIPPAEGAAGGVPSARLRNVAARPALATPPGIQP